MATRRQVRFREDGAVIDSNGRHARTNKQEKCHSVLDALIKLDCQLSSAISIGDRPKTTLVLLARASLKFLEITGHGIPWLFAAAYFAYMDDGYTKIFSLNLFIALVFDLMVVGTLKVASRRQRPIYNKDDMFATVSVDKYSFPSGHATRAALLAFIFMYFNLPWIYMLIIRTWSIVLSISRIVLGRHHVFDVVAGVIIGAFEALIVLKYIWIDENKLKSILFKVNDFIH